MKKIISVLTCALLITNLGFTAKATDINSYTSKLNKKNITVKLEPYQKVIDKINKQYGASINIPTENIEEVYNNISNTPLDVFEAKLRKDYEEVKNSETNVYININGDDINQNVNSNVQENKVPVTIKAEDKGSIAPTSLNSSVNGVKGSVIVPYSVRTEITQDCPLENGQVFLTSEVYSPTGVRGTYSYSYIINAGYYEFTDRTHFRSNSYTYTLQNSNKNCRVVYKGSLFSQEGVDLAVSKTVTITYTAG